MASKVDKGKVATAWLSNEAVIYTLLGLLGLGALFVLIKYGQGLFSRFVDWIISLIQGFVPKPKTQNPDQRTAADAITGLVYANQGDRAASDAVDALTLQPNGDDNYDGYLVGTEAQRIAAWQAAGYLDANANWTDAGKAALASGALAEPSAP